ncbi:hypothetical protein HGRIS_014815 [Hohenbuehelia grisea]|uniref:Uncharacterized protein n=1 Tax=Hohenbuehelia grisea TaxID=104357 RepID=A0ABR3IQV8_9AGAR
MNMEERTLGNHSSSSRPRATSNLVQSLFTSPHSSFPSFFSFFLLSDTAPTPAARATPPHPKHTQFQIASRAHPHMIDDAELAVHPGGVEKRR